MEELIISGEEYPNIKKERIKKLEKLRGEIKDKYKRLVKETPY